MALKKLKPGEIATIVTYLDMREKPEPEAMPPSLLRLRRWRTVDATRYRRLFRLVGGPWLWFSRLAMETAELEAIIGDPGIHIYAVEEPGGTEVGLLELDFRKPGECELSFLGLAPHLPGKGHGRWLMAHALALAWRPGVKRVHVHTCTLDHPSALGFYIRSGFTPRGRAVESFADPRLAGLLPADAAPHMPLLGVRRTSGEPKDRRRAGDR